VPISWIWENPGETGVILSFQVYKMIIAFSITYNNNVFTSMANIKFVMQDIKDMQNSLLFSAVSSRTAMYLNSEFSVSCMGTERKVFIPGNCIFFSCKINFVNPYLCI
jgi:hypothetical protein